ncbi:MAG: IS200/IS605 family transposase [Ignavibacteria bacterium]|nr:IS200/IS605 family transposase [Ignavibacteria bacterium]
MPYIKIWLHCVWNTKRRQPLLSKEIRQNIFNHIKDYSREKKIFIDIINGSLEHVHCLISLGSEQNISKVINLLKGESSHWINNHKLIRGKFEWQDDYFAVSISESVVDKVRKYIDNQEEHHRKISFKEEYDEFIKKYRFKYLG